jgi:deazaflavin-dependent oxidoreductase (nitroreductase family)
MENLLRRGFKYFNRFMLWMWHIGLGKMINFWPPVVGRIMVLTTTGRKSGQPRQTPVNYAMIEGDVFCTAGFGSVSDWYRNICACPRVEIWLPEGKWHAEAEEISPVSEHLDWMRQVLIGSGFAAFAAGINPYRISSLQLQKLCQDYRLIRLHRREKISSGER